MCMLIYSPQGKAISGNLVRHINARNGDGIGVMANGTTVRFLGRTQGIDALTLVRALAAAKIPYGLHFRWATHGDLSAANVHPFAIPDTDMYVMHNGVIGWLPTDGVRSDTATYVDEFLSGSPGVASGDYWRDVETDIGAGNKMLVMDGAGSFRILNEYLGDWIDGIWYSQTYSLPRGMQPYRPPVTRYTSVYDTASESPDDKLRTENSAYGAWLRGETN